MPLAHWAGCLLCKPSNTQKLGLEEINPPASLVPEMVQGASPSCCQPVAPEATTWLHVFFPRLFTAEETKEIRNTTFHDVLAAVTYTDPTDLQSHVFVWSEGEGSVQWQGTGSEQH